AAQPVALEESLQLPAVGTLQVRVLTSNLLDLTRITTKASESARLREWDFIDSSGHPHLPGPSEFVVLVDGVNVPVEKVGFKRRVLYAPLAKRDLRIGNDLYLQLAKGIDDIQLVEVKNPSAKLWPAGTTLTATKNPRRVSPMI